MTLNDAIRQYYKQKRPSDSWVKQLIADYPLPRGRTLKFGQLSGAMVASFLIGLLFSHLVINKPLEATITSDMMPKMATHHFESAADTESKYSDFGHLSKAFSNRIPPLPQSDIQRLDEKFGIISAQITEFGSTPVVKVSVMERQSRRVCTLFLCKNGDDSLKKASVQTNKVNYDVWVNGPILHVLVDTI